MHSHEYLLLERSTADSVQRVCLYYAERTLFMGSHGSKICGTSRGYLKPDSVTAKASIAKKASLKNVGIHALSSQSRKPTLIRRISAPCCFKETALLKDELAAADMWDAMVAKRIDAIRATKIS